MRRLQSRILFRITVRILLWVKLWTVSAWTIRLRRLLYTLWARLFKRKFLVLIGFEKVVKGTVRWLWLRKVSFTLVVFALYTKRMGMEWFDSQKWVKKISELGLAFKVWIIWRMGANQFKIVLSRLWTKTLNLVFRTQCVFSLRGLIYENSEYVCLQHHLF